MALRKYGFPGEKYGKLTIIKEIENKSNKYIRKMLCECECGNKRIVQLTKLRNGKVSACYECVENERINNTLEKHKELIGKKFGRLTVLSVYYDKVNVVYMAECSCDCGNKCDVYISRLISGNTSSCGCLEIEEKSKTKKKNSYDLSNEYGIGHTEEGVEFYFDIEDYDKLKDYYWHEISAGCNIKYIGTMRKIDNKVTLLLMHRLVMGVLDNPDVVVDHIKHNTYDNRKSQLRVCKSQENSFNHKKLINNTSGHTGIRKEDDAWVATICVNNKHNYLGRFKNLEDAIKARKEAEEKYFGEFSFYNSMNANLSEEVIN